MGGQKLTQDGLEVGRLIAGGSVLMVCIGATIGKVGYTEIPVSCNQQINTLTANDLADVKYLYYVMSSEKFQAKIKQSSNQMTLPIINKTAWSNLTVDLPSIDRQKEIVKKLDDAFNSIRSLKNEYTKRLTKLTDLRQSLLAQAFSVQNKV